MDELCDAGKLSRNYCQKCGSKDTKPLNYISHSASVVQLQFLFQVLLKDRIKDKVVLDVGSRLGAVLYAVGLFILFSLPSSVVCLLLPLVLLSTNVLPSIFRDIYSQMPRDWLGLR